VDDKPNILTPKWLWCLPGLQDRLCGGLLLMVLHFRRAIVCTLSTQYSTRSRRPLLSSTRELRRSVCVVLNGNLYAGELAWWWVRTVSYASGSVWRGDISSVCIIFVVSDRWTGAVRPLRHAWPTPAGAPHADGTSNHVTGWPQWRREGERFRKFPTVTTFVEGKR